MPCALEAALLLIETGRNGMGHRLLRPLPRRMLAALAAARREGVEEGRRHVPPDLIAKARAELLRLDAQVDGQRIAAGVLEREIARGHAELRRVEDAIAARRRTLARLGRQARPDPGGKSMRNHQRLADALRDGRVTAGRVAEVLKVRPADVAGIAEGRVRLSTAAWRRAMAEVGA